MDDYSDIEIVDEDEIMAKFLREMQDRAKIKNKYQEYRERVQLRERDDYQFIIDKLNESMAYSADLDDMHKTMRHQARRLDMALQDIMHNTSAKDEFGIKKYLAAGTLQSLYRQTAKELRQAKNDEK